MLYAAMTSIIPSDNPTATSQIGDGRGTGPQMKHGSLPPGLTRIEMSFESDKLGVPVSVAVKMTVYVPAPPDGGVQVKVPVVVSKLAPAGRPEAESEIVFAGTSGSVALTWKVMRAPFLTV